MRIKIYYDKDVNENAALYFERAKKLRKKQEGVIKVIEDMRKRIKEKMKEKAREKVREGRYRDNKKRDNSGVVEVREGRVEESVKNLGDYENDYEKWFMRFRWFFTSNGYLAIGGRDASTNELLIKKHMSKNDLVFHTESPGSPFFLLKLNKNINEMSVEERNKLEKDIQEVAQATACYSKAWGLGVVYDDVYYVMPEQLTKRVSGEYLKKGSFMIIGKRNYVRQKLEFGVGRIEEKKQSGVLINIFVGPLLMVESRSKKYLVITPGGMRKNKAIKRIIELLLGKTVNKTINKALNKTLSKGLTSFSLRVNTQQIPWNKLHDVLQSLLPPGELNIENVF